MLPEFKSINKFVFTPGHGQGDPGAVAGNGRKEADNVVKICQYIGEYSRQKPIPGATVEIRDPNNTLGLQASIDDLNRNYPAYNDARNDNVLAFEIHQDMNAPQLPDPQENGQMGVYYFDKDSYSANIATALCNKFISFGAYNVADGDIGNFAGSWRRGHYLPWAGFYLGWIQLTKPLAMIIENGYVSGRNSDEDLKRFAFWIYKALYELKTGLSWDSNNNQSNNNNNNNNNMVKARETIAYERLLANQVSNADTTDLDIRAAIHGWRGEDPSVKFIPDFEFLVLDLINNRKLVKSINEQLAEAESNNSILLQKHGSETQKIIQDYQSKIKELEDTIANNTELPKSSLLKQFTDYLSSTKSNWIGYSGFVASAIAPFALQYLNIEITEAMVVATLTGALASLKQITK